MIKILYDAKFLRFKSPFGAVETDETVIFSLHIFSDEVIGTVRLVYRQDGKSEQTFVSMKESENKESCAVFSAHVTFDTPNLYFYRFEVDTTEGTKFIGKKDGKAAIEDWLPEWQLTVYDKNFKTPDWVKGAIMYQIFPDRFARSESFTPLPVKNQRKMHKNWHEIPEFIYDTPDYKANDYFGGNIEGIIEKLEYIHSLGANIIYLNPIFESPEYHRYSTADYKRIDPYFGTNKQFQTLCKDCEALGIKVILDGVFSHTGADSIYFNKYEHYDSIGAYNNKKSPYYNWYRFHAYPEKYECWWGFENLPNVKETTPSYLEFITGHDGVVEHWQSLGASGWRLDVADELPDEFLDAFYKAVKTKNPNAFIIGEVWEDASNKISYGNRRRYLLGGQMDSVMNYPWRTAILDFVESGDEAVFHERIMTVLENYPSPVLHCLMNSLSTHDTVRAITHFGVSHPVADTDKGQYVMTEAEYKIGKQKLLEATFLQFTLPGIPCIYYGDEVGLQGFRDPYCRMPYPYGKEDFEILDFYKKIVAVRKQYRTDFSSPFSLLDAGNGLYAFKRGKLLCAINLGDKTISTKSNNGEILFSHGEIRSLSHRIVLSPNSMAILCF